MGLLATLGLKILESVAAAIGMVYGRKIASKVEEESDNAEHRATGFWHRATRRNKLSADAGRVDPDATDLGIGIVHGGSKYSSPDSK